MRDARNPFPLTVPALVVLLFAVVLDGLVMRPWTLWLDAALVLGAAALCLGSLRGTARYFVLALAVGSAYLGIRFRIPPVVVARAATSGGLVLGFLLLVEVLGAAVRAGGYDAALTGLLAKHTRSPGGLRRAAGAGGFVLSLTGMFLGAVPASFFALGGEPGERSLPLAISASRGFAAATLVNPLSPLVVLALASSHASLPCFLAYASPICGLMLLLDWIPRKEDRAASGPGKPPAGGGWTRGQALAVAAAIAGFAGVFETLGTLEVNSLVRIGLAVAAAGACIGAARPGRFWAALRVLPQERFSVHAGAAPLFVTGGLFGSLLFASGLVDPLVLFVRQAHLPWLEFPLLVVLISALRWVGLAPVISLMVLGPVFAPVVSLAPPLYALALTFGGIAGFLGSPLSATNLFVSSVTGFTSFEICFRRQTPYVAVVMAISTVYVLLLALWVR